MFNLTRSKFPNSTALNGLTTFTLSDISTYGAYIQVALGVAPDLNSVAAPWTVPDLLSVIPTNPTLSDLANYVYNRIMALETDPNAPIAFRPRLEMVAPNRRIGFDLTLNFNGKYLYIILNNTLCMLN